jgi:adenosylcobyric acid synthase
VIRLHRVSYFDDFDTLAEEAGVQVRFVERLVDFGQPAAIIIPVSMMTVADLAWLHERGLAERIIDLAYASPGTSVVGICGGYQLLGQSLYDPDGGEAPPGTRLEGLGLLPIYTTFAGDKRTVQVQATLQAEVGPFATLKSTPIHGYEIHMGRSDVLAQNLSPLCRIGSAAGGHLDGVIRADGRVWGTYLHGLFNNDSLRHTWLRSLGWQGEGHTFDRQQAYNRLADHVRSHLDMTAVRQILWG